MKTTFRRQDAINTVRVPFTHEEREKIDEFLKQHGYTKGGFARKCMLEQMQKEEKREEST